MGMVINEAIKILEHYDHGFCENSGGLSESIKVAISIMHKYRKIREIAFPLQFCSTDKLEHEAIMKICEVLEDGKID